MAETMRDACSLPDLLPLDDALARIADSLIPVTATETLPLLSSLDRVVAMPIYAPVAVPAGDNSAMDGYAVRTQDCGVAGAELALIGQTLAGHPFDGDLKAGQAVRIMTGGLIPAGADAVVMQERVVREGNCVRINATPHTGENIRRAGEDIALGSLVLPEGRRLSALDIGLLASIGVAQVTVRRRVRVAVLSTGDELLPLGATAQGGKIYDSNRPLLLALLQRLNVEVLDLGLIPDQPDALRAAFIHARNEADAVISSGGVSVGDADYTKDILAELGDIDLWKIAIKPGKPFAFGRLDNAKYSTHPCWFFGLPGNPVSTAVTYHQLVVPGLRWLSGEVFDAPTPLIATAMQGLKKQPGRMDFQRGLLSADTEKNQVISAGLQSSGVLSAMAQANCYIQLALAQGNVAEGESVAVIPFDKFIQ